MKKIILYFIFIFGNQIHAQEFSSLELFSVPDFKINFEKHFRTIEVPNVELKNLTGLIYIPNALRSSKFEKTESWDAIKDSVEVTAIDVVFSKYPIRKNGYQMYYPLLQSRLLNLFDRYPELNSNSIQWGVVLQTKCNNDDEANLLFHGVRIYYSKLLNNDFDSNDSIKEQTDARSDILKRKDKEILESFNAQNGIDEVEENLKNIEVDLPEDIQNELKDKSLSERINITTEYYNYLLDSLPETDRENVDKAYLKKNKTVVKKFMSRYKGTDNVVTDILDRNLNWKKSLVVADWTGSMYGYGSQVLMWHINHFETSGLTYFTLFNDGNHKINKDIGETEGVYFEKADNIERVVALYNLVQTKGGGGDGPENDVEAILKGMEKYPVNEEIILIADNNACVRDLELSNLIGSPVRIILCGYNPSVGVNPQYIELARVTKGSIHTIDDDILYTDIEKYIEDNDIGLYNYCEGSYKEFRDLKKAKRKKKQVRKLLLSNQDIKRIPLMIGKYKRLVTLDLSSNSVKKLGNSLDHLTMLQDLNLAQNDILKFDKSLYKLRYLVRLDLRYNKIIVINNNLNYSYLTHLDLSNNKISFVKGINCKRLQVLNLSNNNLDKIPRGIRVSKELRNIDLSSNPIKELNSDIGTFKYLTHINLSNCELTSVIKYLRKLRKLEEANISGNDISLREVERIKLALPKTKIIF